MDDLNRPETEEDAKLTQDRRRFQALRALQALQAQTPDSSPQQVGAASIPPELAFDPNRPETEEDGIKAGALRLLKARHQSQAFRDQSNALLPSGAVRAGSKAAEK